MRKRKNSSLYSRGFAKKALSGFFAFALAIGLVPSGITFAEDGDLGNDSDPSLLIDDGMNDDVSDGYGPDGAGGQEEAGNVTQGGTANITDPTAGSEIPNSTEDALQPDMLGQLGDGVDHDSYEGPYEIASSDYDQETKAYAQPITSELCEEQKTANERRFIGAKELYIYLIDYSLDESRGDSLHIEVEGDDRDYAADLLDENDDGGIIRLPVDAPSVTVRIWMESHSESHDGGYYVILGVSEWDGALDSDASGSVTSRAQLEYRFLDANGSAISNGKGDAVGALDFPVMDDPGDGSTDQIGWVDQYGKEYTVWGYQADDLRSLALDDKTEVHEGFKALLYANLDLTPVFEDGAAGSSGTPDGDADDQIQDGTKDNQEDAGFEIAGDFDLDAMFPSPFDGEQGLFGRALGSPHPLFDDEEGDEGDTGQWTLTIKYYDDGVELGREELDEILWDASNGGYGEGQRKVITIQITYRNTHSNTTYMPGDLTLSIPNLTYASTSAQWKSEVIVSANTRQDPNKPNEKWQFENGNTNPNPDQEFLTFTNIDTFEEDTQFEGSINIQYTLIPREEVVYDYDSYDNRIERYDPSCTHEFSRDIKATLTGRATAVSNEIGFNYTRTYPHTWRKAPYYVTKSARNVATGAGLEDADDHIWVRFDFTINGATTYLYQYERYPYIDLKEFHLIDEFDAECPIYDSSFNRLETSPDPDDPESTVLTIPKDAVSRVGEHYEYSIIVGYPKEKYNEENGNLYRKNTVHLWGTYADRDDAEHLSEADAFVNLADFGFRYPPGDYAVLKKGKTYGELYYNTGGYDVEDIPYQSIVSQNDDERFNMVQWTVSGIAHISGHGRPETIEIGDDLLFNSKAPDGEVSRTPDDGYYYSRLQIPDLIDGNGQPMEAGKYEYDLFVRYAGDPDGQYSKYNDDPYPCGARTIRFEEKNIVGWYVRIYDMVEDLGGVDSTFDILADMYFVEDDILDTGTLFNFDYIKAYVRNDDGFVWVNPADDDSYETEATRGLIGPYDKDFHGSYMRRAGATKDWSPYRMTDAKPYMYAQKNNEGALSHSPQDEAFYGRFKLTANIKTTFDYIANQYDMFQQLEDEDFFTNFALYDLLPLGMELESSEDEIMESMVLDAILDNWTVDGDHTFDDRINFFDKGGTEAFKTTAEAVAFFKEHGKVTITKNWRGTHRTHIAIEFDFSDRPLFVYGSTAGTGRNFWANFDFFYDYSISYDSYLDYGSIYRNYVYGYSTDDIAYSSAWSYDQGIYDPQARDINDNNITNDRIMPSDATVNINYLVSTHQDVTKFVDTDHTEDFVTGTARSSNDTEYTYKLRVRTGQNSVSGLVIYDSLEKYAMNPDGEFVPAPGDKESWQGSFVGIDTSQIEGKVFTSRNPNDPTGAPMTQTVHVKAWYSGEEDPGSLYVGDAPGSYGKRTDYNENWMPYTDSVAKDEVKALAFEYLDQNGNPAILPSNSLTYVLITMKAPTIEETGGDTVTLAYNGCWTEWQALDDFGRLVDRITGINSNIVKVSLGDMIDIEGVKHWDTKGASVEIPDEVTIILLQNGQEYRRTAASAENGWAYRFEDVPKTGPDGRDHEYSVTEERLEDFFPMYKTSTGTELKFNSSSRTESTAYDYVYIYYELDGKMFRMGPYGGTTIANQTVRIPSDNFWLWWRTDISNHNYYGFSIDYINQVDLDSITPSGSEANTLPEYPIEEVSGRDYPESPNHGAYGDNVNMVWHYDNSSWSTEPLPGCNDLTNVYDKTKMEGVKSWSGGTKDDRPDSITVRLIRDGEEMDSRIVTSSDGWRYSFDDLSIHAPDGHEYEYRIVEDALDDYLPRYGADSNGLEIQFGTNSETESTSFDYVYIYYEYEGNIYRLGPYGGNSTNNNIADTVVRIPADAFYLYWRTDGSVDGYYGFDIDHVNGIYLEDTSPVGVSGESLPNHTPIEVTGDEYPESSNHGSYGNGVNMLWHYTASHGALDVTNVFDYYDISGTKTWLHDEEGRRPESIEVILYQDDEEIARTTTDAEHGWTYSFERLRDHRPDGSKYEYRVEEVPVEGYRTTYDGFDITNEYVYKDIPVTKSWVGDDESKRPGSIIFKLLQNGEEYREAEVAADDGWAYTFTDVPIWDADGVEYEYEVEELDVDGYESSAAEAKNGLAIKFGDDSETNGSYSLKDQVYVFYELDGKLYKQGPYGGAGDRNNIAGTVVEVPTKDFWISWYSGKYNTTTYKKVTIDYIVPIDCDATPGIYAAELPDRSLYTSSEITGTNYPTFPQASYYNSVYRMWHYTYQPEPQQGLIEDEQRIVNTYAKKDVTGIKQWLMDDPSKRPDGITLVLYQDGVEYGRTTTDADSGWEYSFEDVPIEAPDGHEYEYTVEEVEVENYTQIPTDDYYNGLSIRFSDHTGASSWDRLSIYYKVDDKIYRQGPFTTDNIKGNTLEVPTKDFYIYWYTLPNAKTDTVHDYYGFSIDAIDSIHKDGKPGTEVDAMEEHTEWADVADDVYPESLHNPTEVDAHKIWHYTYTGSSKDLVNEYDLQDIKGKKTWTYDREEDRPDSITVILYQDGVRYGDPIEVTAEDGWEYIFSDVPKTAPDGHEYAYRVEEIPVENYTPTYGAAYNGLRIRFDPSSSILTPDHNTEDKVEIFYQMDGETYRLGPYMGSMRDLTVDVPTTDFYLYFHTYTYTSHWSYGFKVDDAESVMVDGKPGTKVDGLPGYDPIEVSGSDYPESIHGPYQNYADILWHYTGLPAASEPADGLYSVTNNYEMVDVSGQKTWLNDSPDDRPDSIRVVLLRNGEEFDSAIVTKDDDWAYSFSGLPKYDDDGSEYAYSVREDEVPDYDTAYRNRDKGLAIRFSDESRTYGSSSFVEIFYQQDGKIYSKGRYYGNNIGGAVVEVPTNDFYLYWETLDAADYHGFSIDSIRETVIGSDPGVESSFPTRSYTRYEVSGDEYPESAHFPHERYSYKMWHYTAPDFEDSDVPEAGSFDIINTFKLTHIRGSKVWRDEDPTYRPDEITLVLYQDGEEYSRATTDEENGWEYAFMGVPEYAPDGHKYEYTVKELPVFGYDTSYKGKSGLTIRFSDRCETESSGTDYVYIYYEIDGVMYSQGPYAGRGVSNNIAGAEVSVPTNDFYLYWHTDVSVDSYYGFSIDSIAPSVVDGIPGKEDALPSYEPIPLEGDDYPESPNHGAYGNHVNMLWHYTGAEPDLSEPVPGVYEVRNDANGKVPGLAVLQAKKSIERELIDGEFSFEMIEIDDQGNEIQPAIRMASNDDEGSVAFKRLWYGEPGIHSYLIREVPGSDPTIRYSDLEYKAVVTVDWKDDAEEELVTSVEYLLDGEPIEEGMLPEFVNELVTDVGNLEVTKNVIGDESDKQGEFGFKVTLSDRTINGGYGEMEFVDGIAEFVLRDGETKTASGLPAGIGYSVEETDICGADHVYAHGEEGSIEGGKLSHSTFSNAYEHVSKTEVRIGDSDLDEDEDLTNEGNITIGPAVAAPGGEVEGDRVTYEIVWNNFTDEVADVTIDDRLDIGVDLIAASTDYLTLSAEDVHGGVLQKSDADETISYSADHHSVQWVLSGVEPGGSGKVTLVVQVNDKADLKWSYKDPDKDPDGITDKDHAIVNKATVTVGNESTSTGTVRNPLQGLFIEKIHAVVSTHATDGYLDDMFENDNEYDLPTNAYDEADGLGFTGLLDEDTDDNDYKRLFWHSPGNTVRYYIKVTNNMPQTLENVVIVDPVLTNAVTGSDVQTSFNGVAGQVGSKPSVQGRTQTQIAVKRVSDGLYAITPIWEADWGIVDVTLRMMLPDAWEYEGAWLSDGVQGTVSEPDGQDPVVEWSYAADSALGNELDTVYLRIGSKDGEDDLSDAIKDAAVCFFDNNIEDSGADAPNSSVGAIYNADNGLETAGQGYLRWQVKELPGTDQLKETPRSADGYDANTYIVWFDCDIPYAEIDDVTMWENTAYVETYDNIERTLASRTPAMMSVAPLSEDPGYEYEDGSTSDTDSIFANYSWPTLVSAMMPSNTVMEAMDPGDLTITKVVSGLEDGETPSDSFEFEIDLTTENQVDGSGTYPLPGTWDILDADGNGIGSIVEGHGSFELVHGGKAVIKNLPSGTRYEIDEVDVDGYTVSGTVSSNTTEAFDSTSVQGSFDAAGQDASVAFVNTPAGSLDISKTVTGQGAEADREFTFEVHFIDEEGLEVQTQFPYKGSKSGSISSGDRIMLKDGEAITIYNVPMGITYSVLEVEANRDGYLTEGNGTSGVIADSSHASFINEKVDEEVDPTTLTVEKVWDDGELSLSHDPIRVQLLENGSVSPREDAVIELDESNNWMYTWTDLDAESVWSVSEIVPDGYDQSTSMRGARWTITNVKTPGEPRLDTGDLEVSKKVTGTDAELDRAFNFVVETSPAVPDGVYGDMTFENGKAAVSLKHGESVKATNLPAGTLHEIIEVEADKEGYTTKSVGDKDEITAGETNLASFENHRDGSRDDGKEESTSNTLTSDTGKVAKTGDPLLGSLGLVALMACLALSVTVSAAIRRRVEGER